MNHLRVALIVGTLGQGGAEKQLVYIARALQQSGVQVRVYCLTKNEYYEMTLINNHLSPIWVGKVDHPVWRLVKLTLALRNFRPHIIQSAHFYTNLYASFVAPLYKANGIGSLRSDAFSEVIANGYWGLKLLKIPQAVIANSNTAKSNAVSLGARGARIFVLPNAIDLADFDLEQSAAGLAHLPFHKTPSQVNVVVVGSLVPAKRFDRFLRALQKARTSAPALRGYVVGDGEEQHRLECLAGDLGLLPDGVCFVGRHDNIPAILSQADFLVLSSDNEGMPNVILEAMAARLPVITTPAGDASLAVEHGVTGFVVPFEDVEALADRMVSLSVSPELRKQLGEAGRKRVEQYYSYDLLGKRLLRLYTEIGSELRSARLQKALYKQNSPKLND